MRNSKAAKTRKLIAFGWYGGKFSHLEWLLPLLPPTYHYCEPFGGSAAVLLNRIPAPVETYNDLDGEVANFFRVLRDAPDELIRRIALTPFSREELRLACSAEKSNDPIERARRFYVRARQTRTGLAQTATPGRWAYCVGTSRAGVAGAVSRWFGGVEALFHIADRLLGVQIESLDALEVIRKYDSPDTLFYCDPPYVHGARGDVHAYAYEMSDADHRRLAELLHTVQGKVALSGYRCELMDSLYLDWYRTDAPPRICHSVKQIRQEVLWTNYDPQEALQQNQKAQKLSSNGATATLPLELSH